MSRDVTIVIDPERCTGCGLCVRVCPRGTLSIRDGKAVAGGSRSMGCGHCEAVCPAGAVRVEGLAAEAARFETFLSDDKWLPPGQFDAGLLIQLMRSRRSCRNYQERPVAEELLRDLVRAGISAPSGTNSQQWTFTILGSRREVMALGERVAVFFERLNRLAVNPLARLFSRLFGGDALGRYHREHFKSTAAALRAWREEGRDHLFHGATAAILVGSRPGASCPAEDALLATQNILLAAHALGLGSCLIGFVVEAMKRDGTIKEAVSIPAKEPVYAVIGLGWPDEKYQRVSGRKWPLVRVGNGQLSAVSCQQRPKQGKPTVSTFWQRIVRMHMGHRIWTFLYALWVAAVVVLSLVPSPPEIEIGILSWDKVQHAGAYAVMTLLGGLSMGHGVRPPFRSWLVSLGGAVFLGILLEVVQGLMRAGRFADWQDAVANTLGAVTMLLLVVIIRPCRPR